MNREKKIIQTSIIGILANVLLVAGKALVGFIAGSISVILDAVNNLTDALSSIITIIGTKLANKKPDKKHPYGHGRIEYLTSLIIAVIILIAGVTAIYESILSLINGTESNYSYVSLIVIGVAVLAKIAIGLYFKKVGKETNSEALKGSGVDALFDALLSLATLIGVIVSLIWQVYIEGYLGIIIGIFIIKSGIELLRTSISNIIGERVSKETALAIKKEVNSFPEVIGAYDLILNNYGPNKTIGSIHIEIDDDLTAKDIHPLTRKISEKIYEDFGVILTVGIYASNSHHPEVKEIRKYVYGYKEKYPVLQEIHGFYVDFERKLVSFDIIVDFKDGDAEQIKNEMIEDLKKKFPDYNYSIIIDIDFAD